MYWYEQFAISEGERRYRRNLLNMTPRQRRRTLKNRNRVL